MPDKIIAPAVINLNGHLVSPTNIDYEAFDKILRTISSISNDSREDIMATYILTKYAHSEQSRQSGERFFDHPKAVALIGILEMGETDPDLIKACLIHDIPEDTSFRAEHLSHLVGETSANVSQLLKNPIEKTEEALMVHYNTIKLSTKASAGKVLDRIHNLRTLTGPNISTEKVRRKLVETKTYIVPLLEFIVKEKRDIYRSKLMQAIEEVEKHEATLGE